MERIVRHPPRAQRTDLKAVVFDWAGTLIDFGSCAPAQTFVELFRREGVAITVVQAREPMGKEKREHISDLLAMPEVARRWKVAHGREATEADIDRLYEAFLPLQLENLRRHADLIPGTLDALQACRSRGLKIGSSSGYARALTDVLVPIAAEQGCQVDAVVSASDVPAGRPAPWMIWENAKQLNVYPPSAIVVVDDTPVGVEAGRNAGAWSVGVVASGNLVGLSREEFEELSNEQREQACAVGYQKMKLAGAHLVINSVAELPQALEAIEKWCAGGERP